MMLRGVDDDDDVKRVDHVIDDDTFSPNTIRDGEYSY